MKAFKFACPVCGQHITADAEGTGSQIECPTCFQKIVVPQAPASEDSKFILSASQVRKPRPTGTPEEPAPALATSSRKKSWLVVVAGGLLLCSVAAAFVFRDVIFKPAKSPPSDARTPEQRTPTTSSAYVTPVPAEPDPRWKLDLAEVAFTDAAAAGGRIHGVNFTCDRAILQNGTLTLRQGRSGTAELAVNIVLAKQEQNWSGNSLTITPTSVSAPRVVLRWKKDEKSMASLPFNNGYAMKLEFGAVANEKVPGNIYLCTPDDAKSVVVGTFTAEIRKPKPPAVKKPN
jgi:DNA-directed RNA polymerase subunit RPC12/RpoP